MTGIKLTDLTTITSLEDDLEKATGAFDKLMISARAQINNAVNNQEITQSEAGAIFSNALSSVLSSSLQFVLNRDKADAETAKIRRDTI